MASLDPCIPLCDQGQDSQRLIGDAATQYSEAPSTAVALTWDVDRLRATEVLAEEVGVERGAHQDDLQIRPLGHHVLQDQQQEVTNGEGSDVITRTERESEAEAESDKRPTSPPCVRAPRPR